MKNWDIIRENLLLITNFSLFHFDFANAYYICHNEQIEQYIRYFVILFQTTSLTKYAYKLMHMIAYFRRLWKKNVKKVQLEFYFINIFSQLNKYILDNWFDETIIILNTKNINPSNNAKSDKFFWEIISQNVL